MARRCGSKFLFYWIIIITLFFQFSSLFAGITGKLAGTVLDAETGEPLPGVNIIIENMYIGASTDMDGFFTILNIPPGEYIVEASFIGYRTEIVENVIISVDRTSALNFKLKTESLELGDEIVVVATREKVRTDVSFTQTSITAKDVKVLPATSDIRETIEFAPGVYRNDRGQIEIRGGQMDEVGVYVDDISMQNASTGVGVMNLPKGAIQEIQVVRGGFNAEYGQAQSGIINIVTKSGQQYYSGSIVVSAGLSQQKHFGPNYFSPENYYHVGRFLEMDRVTKKMSWLGDDSEREIFGGWNNIWSDSLKDSYSQSLNRPSQYGNSPEEALEIWKWRHRPQEYSDEPDLNIDGTLTGPVPFTNNKVDFVVAGHYNRSIYPFRFQQKDYTEFSGNWKLNYRLNNHVRISYHGILSKMEGSSYRKGSTRIADPRHWLSSARVMADIFDARGSSTGFYNADSYLKLNGLHMISHTLKTNIVFNNNSYLDAYVSYKKTEENVNLDIPYRNLNDIEKTIGMLDLDSAPFNFVSEVEGAGVGIAWDVFGIHRIGGQGINGYDYSSNKTITFKADYNNQFNNVNLFKAGLWISNQNMNINTGYKDLITTEDGELSSVRTKGWWEREIPFYEFAGYIQDKIEIEGLVLNIGLRADGLYNIEPNRPLWSDVYSLGNIEDTLYNMPESVSPRNNWQFYLSPRIGIAHPIGENSKIFLNYGYFYQRPSVEQLFYDKYRPDNPSATLEQISSPNLKFRKTIQYELGFEQMVKDWFRVTISGYFRDVSNDLIRTELTDKNLHSYDRYFSNSFSDISGFEVDIRIPRHSFVSGWLNFDYRKKTSGVYGYKEYSELATGDRRERSSKPTVTRARPAARANLVFYTPDIDNKVMNSIFSDVTLSFMYQWRTGEYLTYHAGNAYLDEIDPFNLKWKDFSRLDMRLMKAIKIGSTEITLSLDVRNVLNKKYFHPELMGRLSSAKEYTKVTEEYYLDEINRLGLTPGDVDHPEIKNMLEQSAYWIFYGEPLQVWFSIELNF